MTERGRDREKERARETGRDKWTKRERERDREHLLDINIVFAFLLRSTLHFD